MKRKKSVIGHNRKDVSRLIVTLTGNWPRGNHARRLNIQFNDYCRRCKNPNEEDTMKHLITEFPARIHRRQTILGFKILDDLAAISSIDLDDLLRFLNTSGWL